MPKTAETSLAELIRGAIAPVVVRAAKLISRSISDRVAEELEVQLRKAAPRGTRWASRRSSRTEMTKWIADRRARRVPTFVIQATGLDTKKKIVAKYGENAVFEKGTPLPPARINRLSASSTKAARVVRAKPSKVRKTGKKKVS